MKLLWHLAQLISVTTLLLVGGCASTPQPPVTAVTTVSLHAQPNVNPDSDGRASPVVVKFYELKSATAFNATDFFSISESEQKVLGAELINSEVFQLRPGEKLEFDRPLNPDTRHLGAVAEFRDLEHSQWRATLAIPPKAKLSRILVKLEGNKVLIDVEQECSLPCGIPSKKTPLPANTKTEK